LIRRVIGIALFMFTINALFGPVQAQARPRGPCTGMGMQDIAVRALTTEEQG
jgi:hypothetical protein